MVTPDFEGRPMSRVVGKTRNFKKVRRLHATSCSLHGFVNEPGEFRGSRAAGISLVKPAPLQGLMPSLQARPVDCQRNSHTNQLWHFSYA